jgi:hypothetical protein
MLAVAGAAVLLAISTSGPGLFLLILVSHVLAVPVLMGLPMLVFRDRRRRAAWCFCIAAAAGNGVVGAYCVYLLSTYATIFMFCTSLSAVPAILISGVSWLDSATDPTAVPRRSRFVILPPVLVLALTPLTMLTPWPLRLAFLVSQSALEKLADHVAAGKSLGGPQWAGVYRVVGGMIDPIRGNVGLVIDASPGGRSGFTRLGPGTPPEDYYLPFVNLNTAIRLGNRWYYEAED